MMHKKRNGFLDFLIWALAMSMIGGLTYGLTHGIIALASYL